MISTFLDESILVREWRRWKNQRRWRLLLAASVPCAYASLWVIIPLLFGVTRTQPSYLSTLRSGIGVLSCVVMLSSFLLAFVQSMQVLRREAWLQTLDGLFLTRQTSRGVMMSVAVCGVVAGLAVTALSLPVIVMAAVAARVSAGSLIAFVALDIGVVLLGASLGGLWFFVNQNGFALKITPARAALHVL
ncbi:MAG: hypothetical protein LC772_12410, partial [Chloroflexi bacterium]|nr:hypothetical protein [Chloroflexota bacterium]